MVQLALEGFGLLLGFLQLLLAVALLILAVGQLLPGLVQLGLQLLLLPGRLLGGVFQIF